MRTVVSSDADAIRRGLAGQVARSLISWICEPCSRQNEASPLDLLLHGQRLSRQCESVG